MEESALTVGVEFYTLGRDAGGGHDEVENLPLTRLYVTRDLLLKKVTVWADWRTEWVDLGVIEGGTVRLLRK